MAKKDSKIFLVCGSLEREFEVTHAERLLKMPNNGGWELPQDSNYEYNKDNGVISKRNKGNNKKSETITDDK